ncbi:MAG: efflux RND transporter periplasmic adaptor subunit [Desulfuromonadales bacterium]|nr:efflux RND transporter periplasmic adaptor subunit [Desulfuromonadales bacterium]MBN2791861.1 efflux RND transporter periplasmic adaptor subunit [Desulfuromonadales bacterium]
MKKIFFVVLIILLIAVLAGALLRQTQGLTNENGTLTLYGNVEVRDALLAFNEQELVAEVLVEEGDSVQAGQVLARLRSQQLNSRLAEARALFAAQTQALRRLENGARPQEIAQSRAEVEAAEVRVANAGTNLQRLKETATIGATSQQTLDDARAQFNIESAQLKVARQKLALLLEGSREEDIKQARAQLEANRQLVTLLEARLEDTTLKAPDQGIIQSRIIEPGEMAGPTRPAFILAKTDPKWVRAYVPEPSLGSVKEGMQAKVFSDTWPDRAFPGQVGFISPTAEFTPKTVETTDLRTKLVYEIRVYVADPENELRLGMPVTVKFTDEPSE